MTRTLFVTVLVLLAPWALAASAQDPLQSSMWDFHHRRLLEGAPVLFDERVRIAAPPFAEDARQVPIRVDARGLGQPVQQMLAWAELNPIPHIFTLHLQSQRLEPALAVRIRIEQATILRVAALTADGVWHIGSTHIDAAGGGCTAPSQVRSQPGWEQRLGQVHGARFASDEGSRLRLRIDHPMDNGLVGGIPEFFLNQARLLGAEGEPLGLLELFPAVAENPSLGFQLRDSQPTTLGLRDNNGNEFKASL